MYTSLQGIVQIGQGLNHPPVIAGGRPWQEASSRGTEHKALTSLTGLELLDGEVVCLFNALVEDLG